MSDEDSFVQGILNNPDDDTSRLVFADWLEEHGRALHAELIRVQCEQARLPRSSREPKAKAHREKLTAREKELLRQPEFFPTWPTGTPNPGYEVFKRSSDAPKLKYERGFIAAIRVLDNELMATEWAESPWHTLLREGKALAVELQPDQHGFVNAGEHPTQLQPPFELVPDPGGVPLSSYLGPYGLEGLGYEMADLAKHPILCRVTRLHLFEANLTNDNLGVLARSRLLTQLQEVSLGDCTISLDAMRALVTSPSIHKLRVLHMDQAEIADERRGRGVGQLWELVASSPNMASLEYLWIDPLDNKGAASLVKSPHLKESLRLCPAPPGRMGRTWEKWALTGKLNEANVKALRKRYPETAF